MQRGLSVDQHLTISFFRNSVYKIWERTGFKVAVERCLSDEISVATQYVVFHKGRPKPLYHVTSPNTLFFNPKFSGTIICAQIAILPDFEQVISQKRVAICSETLKEEY
jgi:hypothetical protein